MACVKCNDSGRDIRNNPCNCGIETIDNSEEYADNPYECIPENFRGISEDINKNDFIVGELRPNWTLYNLAEEIVDCFMKETPYPSLFMDFSESMTGAYEFYYTVLEIYINKSGTEPPFIFKEMFRINHFDENRLEESVFSTSSEMNIKKYFNYILSDFGIDKFEKLKEYVKIFPYNKIKQVKRPYPINMFLGIIKSKD